MLNTTLRQCALGAALVTMAACGGGPSGEYADSSGLFKYNFKSGGKVEMTTMGGTVELDYKFEGGKVKLGPQGSQLVWSFDQDGCLDAGGFMGKLCKTPQR